MYPNDSYYFPFPAGGRLESSTNQNITEKSALVGSYTNIPPWVVPLRPPVGTQLS